VSAVRSLRRSSVSPHASVGGSFWCAFFFNATAATALYTLSLHDALPIYSTGGTLHLIANNQVGFTTDPADGRSTRYSSDLAKGLDRKSTRLNSSHVEISYAVFCLKKKSRSTRRASTATKGWQGVASSRAR